MSIYCTYLTVYFGNKLPMFYIGSSFVVKINNGYHGSVSSKKYKSIWQSESKNNPHLFKTKIISYHNTRKSATEKELFLQKKMNVVKSTMYINESFATVNGCYGRDVKLENNPNYNKKFNKSFCENHSKIMHEKWKDKKYVEKQNQIRKSEDYRKKLSESNSKIYYIVIFPTGKKQKIKNLSKFCCLHNLNVSNMVNVAKGNRSQHKGFCCQYA